MDHDLTFSLDDLESRRLDVLVVGSGPAAVAVIEHLYEDAPDASIGVLERGGILSTTHINNVLAESPGGRVKSATNLRSGFMTDHEEFLWEGAFERSGMLILALGGRGIVAGAQLRRFYRPDFTGWDEGRWPIIGQELSDYYTEAEVRRHVRSGDCDGAAQNWVRGQLYDFGAGHPPWGVDSPTLRNFESGQGYDSSVSRLWRLMLLDHQNARSGGNRRLHIGLHAYVSRLVAREGRVIGLECRDSRKPSGNTCSLSATLVILAASPVESARLMLNSGLGNENTGRYLAEHMYCRRVLSVRPPQIVGDIRRLAVRVIVPPQGDKLNDRFQIEILGEEDPSGTGDLVLRFTGEVAMDPQRPNRVTLSAVRDEFNVPKAHVDMNLSSEDVTRRSVMKTQMIQIAERLGVSRRDFDESKIEDLPPGRSHHEAGTLRMGHSEKSAVTDPNGRVYGLENLYVADASVFPCVGVANPMLTVTALGYRLAEQIARVLSTHGEKSQARRPIPRDAQQETV